MWGRGAVGEDAAEGVDAQRDDPWPDSPCVDPPDDPDREKPRASVEEYAALIGDAVALNLDGLARARVEKTATVPYGRRDRPGLRHLHYGR